MAQLLFCKFCFAFRYQSSSEQNLNVVFYSAGKTTLMDVLAGRKTGGYIEGDIRINGYPKKQETFARIAGYCEQDDIHSPQVTIRESLIYSAWLRLAADINGENKMVIGITMTLSLRTFSPH